jgi:hypothetical protein
MSKKIATLYRLLEYEKNEIDALLQYVSSSKFNLKVNDHSWSMAQIIQHIFLAESQTLDAIKWRLKNKNNFPTVSLWARIRVWYTICLFQLQFKLKAPNFVTPIENEINKNDLLKQWQDTRNEWSQLVYKFPKNMENKVVYKHPILGYLSLSLTLKFMFHHLIRHHHQIVTLINTIEHQSLENEKVTIKTPIK